MTTTRNKFCVEQRHSRRSAYYGMKRVLIFTFFAMFLPIGTHAQTFPLISPAGSTKPSKSGSVKYYFDVLSPRDGSYEIDVVNSSGENGKRTIPLKANVPYRLEIMGRKEQRPTPNAVKFTARDTKRTDKTAKKPSDDGARKGVENSAISEPGLNTPVTEPVRWQNPPAKRIPKQMTQEEIDAWKKRPDPYRATTPSSRVTNPREKIDPANGGLKPLIGSWNVSRGLYSFESQMIIRLKIEPTGSGSWSSHQVFRNGDTSTTIWDAQVTTDAPNQWKLQISNCRDAGGRGKRGRAFTMTIQRSSSGVYTGKSPRSDWVLSR